MANGRFAPSPSGPLHVGNLRTAMLAWLFARSTIGRFGMRMEDLTTGAAPVAEAEQLADLEAFGLDWDGPVTHQSKHSERYRAALAELEAGGRIYPCFCTRREIREAGAAPHGEIDLHRYPGTCRSLGAAERARRAEFRSPALRLDAQEAEVSVVDRLLGPQQPGMHVSESIHKVAERVVKLVSMELPDNVTLVRDYDPSLPELAHDPDQIEQVLLNIVRNALQALGPEGGEIILRTRTAFQLTLHGVRYRLAARVDVEDNGPGIPPHLQDTLFYPMVSGREGGTGLGLSIARNLIDQHSGKIEFTSWPGHTEFSVFLPIKK